jgi:hypothetical protein
MRLPQFTAETSIGGTGNHYISGSVGRSSTARGEVTAQISCDHCLHLRGCQAFLCECTCNGGVPIRVFPTGDFPCGFACT